MGKKRVVVKSEEELLAEREKVESAVRGEVKLKVPQKAKEGRVYISSSYNNTTLTLTDPQGKVLYWTSAGKLGGWILFLLKMLPPFLIMAVALPRREGSKNIIEIILGL